MTFWGSGARAVDRQGAVRPRQHKKTLPVITPSSTQPGDRARLLATTQTPSPPGPADGGMAIVTGPGPAIHAGEARRWGRSDRRARLRGQIQPEARAKLEQIMRTSSRLTRPVRLGRGSRRDQRPLSPASGFPIARGTLPTRGHCRARGRRSSPPSTSVRDGHWSPGLGHPDPVEQQPANVSYPRGPEERVDVQVVPQLPSSSTEARPSMRARSVVRARTTIGSSTSYSSWISPTISSSRSSIVTSPAVPRTSRRTRE